MRNILLEYSCYFSKIYDMFLHEIQQSYCYTQLCNFRAVLVFEPAVRNYIFLWVSIWVLKCFLPWNGWIIFTRLNNIKEFAISFPSLILYAVICCFERKYSLTLIKFITVSTPSTILLAFLVGRSGCPIKGATWGEELPLEA